MIYSIEKNIHGAWVIRGEYGTKQYYYYTKQQAMIKYKTEKDGEFSVYFNMTKKR